MGFKEDKPMRHEEYLSMAEELRRTKEENERLRAKKPPLKVPWKHILGVCGVVASLVVIFFGISASVASCDRDDREQAEYNRIHPKPPRVDNSKRPCYYVRHHLMDDDGEPWEKWQVFKSTCLDGCNEWVNMTPDSSHSTYPTFDTQKEAWDWATNKWHLNMCK